EIDSTSIYNPTIAATGGTFGSGSIVYFYWSTTDSATGIIPEASGGTTTTFAFSTQLGAGQTSLSNTVLTPNPSWGTTVSISPGSTLYLLASDTDLSSTAIPATAQFASSVPFTVTSSTPSLELSTSPIASANYYGTFASGEKVWISGSGYSPTATSATIYFNYDGSSTVLGTVAISGGSIIGQYLTVPTDMPSFYPTAYYALVSASNTGETAVAALEITPAVTFSPNVVGTSVGQVITISGTGFVANGWIQLNNAITVPTETNPAVQVSSAGSFSVTITTTSTISTGAVPVTVSEYNAQTSGSTIATASGYIYGSSPSYNDMTVLLGASGGSSDTAASGASELFEAINYPANVQLTLMVGPVSVMTFSTNAYGGFAGNFTVPVNLPEGSYTVNAVDVSIGLSAQTTATLAIEPYFQVNSLRPGYSYLPAGYLEGETGTSTFNVVGFGFPASSPIVIGTSGTSGEITLAFDSFTTSESTSDFSIPSTAETSLNGSFNVTVTIIGYTGFTMNTQTSLTVYVGTTSLSEVLPDAFTQYVSPTLTITATGPGIGSGQLGSPYSSSVPDFITVTSTTLLPSSAYILEFGTQVITTFYTDSTGSIVAKGVSPAPVPSSGVEFAVPNLPSGYYPINLVLSSTQIAIFDPTASFFLITVPGSTPTVIIQDVGAQTYNTASVADNPAGVAVGHSASDIVGDTINIFAYNFPAGSSDFTFFSADGLISTITATAYTTTGAYATGVTIGTVPGGTYLVSATASNSAYGTQVATPPNAALFTVIPSFNAPIYTAKVSSPVSFSVTGLAPNTNYVLLFNGQVITSNGIPTTYLSSGAGSVSGSFTVPSVYVSESIGFSLYNLSIAPSSNPSNILATSVVNVTWPSTITITPDPRAFPNELVSFIWVPASEPPLTSTTPTPIYVTVYLDGSAYETVLGTFNYVSANSQQS
ncbi:MAG: hypothetical protein QW478_14315, partial [Candidatus Micrarchaeaceae archaeon]